jgi:hypothetical protein
MLADLEEQEALHRNALMADQRSDYFKLERLLVGVTYKPGITISARPPIPGSVYMNGVGALVIKARVPDSYDPMKFITVGKHIEVPGTLVDLAETDPRKFYRWVFHQLLDFEKHEAQEWFKINGVLFDNPHATRRAEGGSGGN